MLKAMRNPDVGSKIIKFSLDQRWSLIKIYFLLVRTDKRNKYSVKLMIPEIKKKIVKNSILEIKFYHLYHAMIWIKAQNHV